MSSVLIWTQGKIRNRQRCWVGMDQKAGEPHSRHRAHASIWKPGGLGSQAWFCQGFAGYLQGGQSRLWVSALPSVTQRGSTWFLGSPLWSQANLHGCFGAFRVQSSLGRLYVAPGNSRQSARQRPLWGSSWRAAPVYSALLLVISAALGHLAGPQNISV